MISERPLDGTTVAITGANSGIGLQTALGLARRGAHVVMICRDSDRGAAAQAAIARAVPGATTQLLIADLSVMRQVRRVASELARVAPRLRVLVNNAGLVTARRTMTQDGFEMTFAVNHFAPFLLSTSLLDVLRANAPARIVNVNSDSHLSADLDLGDLDGTHRRFAPFAYGPSKLANMLFTVELARRLDAREVTVNALHPGTVATDFGDVGGLVQFGWIFMKPFAISPERGAKTPIYCAAAPELEGITGGYYRDSAPASPNPRTGDRALAARVWERSESLLARFGEDKDGV